MYEQTKILKIRKVPAGEITISQSVLRLLHGDLMMYRSFLSIDWYLCIEYFVHRDCERGSLCKRVHVERFEMGFWVSYSVGICLIYMVGNLIFELGEWECLLKWSSRA